MPISVFKFQSLFLLLLPLCVAAQTSAKISLPESDTSKAKTESEVANHSIYTGAGYGSNMIYLGSSMSQDQPYGYANLTYGFKNELYASFSAVHLSGFDPVSSFFIGGLNYRHVFNSWFDISAGIYRYEVDKTLTDTLFSSFTFGDATLGVDWKLIYTKFSFGGILSKEPQTYLQIKNSRYFQTPEFFNDKANISFDPYVNLLLGTLITTEIINGTSTITTTQQTNTPWQPGNYKGENSSAGSGSGSSGGYGSGSTSGSGQGSSSDSGSGSSATTTTTTTTTSTVPTSTISYKKSFDLIEIEFGLPVSFNMNFMTIEAEASYILPAYSDPYFPGPKGFIFTLSCFLKIF